MSFQKKRSRTSYISESERKKRENPDCKNSCLLEKRIVAIQCDELNCMFLLCFPGSNSFAWLFNEDQIDCQSMPGESHRCWMNIMISFWSWLTHWFCIINSILDETRNHYLNRMSSVKVNEIAIHCYILPLCDRML